MFQEPPETSGASFETRLAALLRMRVGLWAPSQSLFLSDALVATDSIC
jgi:hypothetical protein